MPCAAQRPRSPGRDRAAARLARRYARALLDVAASQPAGTVQRVEGELVAFARLLETSAELRRVLRTRRSAADARRRVLLAIADSAGASPLMRRLLELLRRATTGWRSSARSPRRTRRRATSARDGWRPRRSTAVPLAEAQKAALAEALRATVGKTVELHARVDQAVLGGVLVRVGGRTYDGTLRARLSGLRARLAVGR